MTVLYLDTSSSYFSAAIYQDGKILNSQWKLLSKDMSIEALPLLKEMLDEVNILPNSIDKILICNGPGSFTGIRIGMTIAKVYAWALQKEIAMVSSLEAMAISEKEDAVLPIIDARRGYVFGALFLEGKALIPEGYYLLEELLKKAEQYAPYTIVSTDSFSNLSPHIYQPNYLKIIETFMSREAISPHLANPCYLKKTEAEEKQSV